MYAQRLYSIVLPETMKRSVPWDGRAPGSRNLHTRSVVRAEPHAARHPDGHWWLAIIYMAGVGVVCGATRLPQVHVENCADAAKYRSALYTLYELTLHTSPVVSAPHRELVRPRCTGRGVKGFFTPPGEELD